MIEDYDGADLIDATDERIGKVERSYVDDTGAVRFVEVKMGGLRAKHRLVPMDQAQRTNDGLKVPFSKDVVEASPDASSAGDELEGETLDVARMYYAGGNGDEDETAGIDTEAAAVPVSETAPRRASTSDSDNDTGLVDKAGHAIEHVREKLPRSRSSGGEAGGKLDSGNVGRVRDLGDVIEVPIVEEELVKRPVVREVLRIRKRQVTEHQSVSGELRKEEIEVDRQGDVDVKK